MYSRTVVSLFTLLLVYSCAIKHKAYTVARVVHAQHVNTSNAYAEYWVGTEKYGIDFTTWESVTNGDCFKVMYDSLHPRNAVVLIN